MHCSFDRRSFVLGAAAAISANPLRALSQELGPVSASGLLMQSGRYLPRYLELLQLVEAGEAGADQVASWFAAIVGDEKGALRLAGAQPTRSGHAVTSSDLQVEDALEAIQRAAGNSRIVILNEAHHLSRHRHFAARVAERLALQGFSYFGAEAFAPPQDGALSPVRTLARGAVLTARAGFYVLDPVFAEAVRVAMRGGMTLFDYEQRADQRQIDPDFRITMAAREQAQAENVAALLQQNADAKVFIYCGYDHVTEEADANGRWFATRLKEITGLDPVTIDQSQNWSRANPQDDPAHVRAVNELAKFQAPISVARNDGRAFTNAAYEGRIDISIFHPQLDDVNGRPGWLASDPSRIPLNIPIPFSEEMRLVQAFRMSEGWGSIPADQFPVVPGGGPDVTLYLPPGEYVVRQEFPDSVDVLGRVMIPVAS